MQAYGHATGTGEFNSSRFYKIESLGICPSYAYALEMVLLEVLSAVSHWPLAKGAHKHIK
ncbi:MAG: hypothetical protein F6K37_39910 [Moorea sp. SIO4E2]|uniref:Uncharacterized protein n=1 Tax=Moorena producens (strain JHB) TaxID=1454205 RepID=A0A1D9G4N6_MOOP1|nr:hypothetical protein [Moorena sp. SIO4E2]